MAEYLIQWKIDIDATDPVEAAKKAREIQLDIGSIATIFEVTDKSTNRALRVNVQEGKNPGKYFWSGLDYIINSFRKFGKSVDFEGGGFDEDFGIDQKSITLSKEEWNAINKQYSELEKAVLDTWEDAAALADGLGMMRWLSPEKAEAFKKVGQTKAEGILKRLKNFVNDEKEET